MIDKEREREIVREFQRQMIEHKINVADIYEISNVVKKRFDIRFKVNLTKKLKEHRENLEKDTNQNQDNSFLQIDGDCKLCGVKGVCHEMLAHHRLGECVNARKDEINSPSQQSSVDKREIVHTKKISDIGENPISDTKFALNKDGGK